MTYTEHGFHLALIRYYVYLDIVFHTIQKRIFYGEKINGYDVSFGEKELCSLYDNEIFVGRYLSTISHYATWRIFFL